MTIWQMCLSKICKVQNVRILLTPLGKAYSPRTVALSRVLVVNGTVGVSLRKQNPRCKGGHRPPSGSSVDGVADSG